VALTEAERKLLAELEQTLKAEDPKLADKLAAPARHVHPTRAVLGGLGIIVGLLALVIGMSVHWAVSVAGFLVMLGSILLVMSAWSPGHLSAKPGHPRGPKPAGSPDFMSKLEERWQHRQQG